MKRAPLFVRPPTEEERRGLEAGLRSRDAFTLRRAQILLASARGERAEAIAHDLGCDGDTVRSAIHAFHAEGLAALQRQSSRPKTLHFKVRAEDADQWKAMLHQRPRAFGKPFSLWTLELAAEIACEQGLTTERLSIEGVRGALKRLGIHWQRAKHWIESPDPAYARKKNAGTDC
jgi:transposase